MIEKDGLIEHHTHYKEIDGYDETVWMTRSEHRLLHNRLREEGKCNIPPEELQKIASAAYYRTEKRKAESKERKQGEKHQEYMRKYNKKYKDEHQEELKVKSKEYYKKNMEKLKAKSRKQYRNLTGGD